MNNGPYHLFAGANYYPSGGMSDYQGSYETLEECMSHTGKHDWFNIAVYKEGRLVIVRDAFNYNVGIRRGQEPKWVDRDVPAS